MIEFIISLLSLFSLISLMSLMSLDFFSFFGIFGVPGSNQINLIHLVRYYINLFAEPSKPSIDTLKAQYNDEYNTIYGYCCRQLFNTFIQEIKNDTKYRNNNINIGVSPIHHTSFRNIIEENFPKENIHILDIDEKYENIIIPNDKKDIKYDLVIITHLWGKYLNFDTIKNNVKDALIVEDVILGGKYCDEFNNNADLIFHSCGMDKRPSSIFGGYVHIKKDIINYPNMTTNILSSINNLELPTKKEIFKKIFDNTILYLLYNIRPIQNIVKLIIYFSGCKLSNVIQQIRKKKPGFEHTNYMKTPTNLMVNISKSIYNTQNSTEELFIRKNKLFLSQFSHRQISTYFPWHSAGINNINVITSCLPYNAIYIDETQHKKIIDYFDKNNICIIQNPTYKTFYHADKKIGAFLNNIFYLPCVYNLTDDEIITLTQHLKPLISA